MSFNNSTVGAIQKDLDETSLNILFKLRELIDHEIVARGEAYLKALGYEWYADKCEIAIYQMTGRQMPVFRISAEFENHFKKESVNHEVPQKLFEQLVPLKHHERGT